MAISLGAAFITAAAALVGSLVRGRHERALQLERGIQERALRLHDRRIEVAGDFSTSAHNAITGIKDAVRSAPPSDRATKDEVLDPLHKRLHEAEGHAALVSLLFETKPDAAEPNDVIELLRVSVREVRALYDDADPTVGDTSREHVRARAEQADAALKRFNEAVLKVLEK